MDPQRIPRSLGNYETQHPDRSEYTEIAGEQGWPPRVLHEMKDLLLVLSSVGRILYASPSCQSITGYTAKQIEGKPLSQLIHEDDRPILNRELDECFATGSPLRSCHFRFNKLNNGPCIFEAHGHAHIARHNVNIGDGNTGRRCDGFFLMCRPYPTKSTRLLDTFLEHKVENIRLNYRIARLKEEEEEELNANRLSSFRQDQTGNSHFLHSQHQTHITSMHASHTQSNVNDSTTDGDDNDSADAAFNVDDNDSRMFVDHLADKLPPAEDLSHIDGIEVMTGLYYGEGERSQGLSTGIPRGRLVQCDIDVTTTDQQSRTAPDGDRRKRLRGEYSCTDCGTSDSPEWRKGPEGPKTLCNACGLRWAKKEKKRQDIP
ncbi:blue light receptor [Aspergillus wentii]|nr:blue light receptor [Aspergillus wentii]